MRRSTAVRQAAGDPTIRLIGAAEMASQMRDIVEAVASHAFEIFERNGRRLGRELEDWLQAEAELLHPVHLEISESDGTSTVKAEIPGFEEQEIMVSIDPHRVTIIARRDAEASRAVVDPVERCADQVFRTAELPVEVETANGAIDLHYDQGELTIRLLQRRHAHARMPVGAAWS